MSAGSDPIGPHDLGGHEAGAIERAEHDLAWWERQVDAMVILMMERGVMKDVAQLRNGIEQLGPDVYERLGYYDRWAASAAALAVESGLITREELDARIAALRDAGGSS